MKEGLRPLATNTMDEEKDAHKELGKKNYKALFMIHECVDANNFEKVSEVESTKEAWGILKNRLETEKR